LNAASRALYRTRQVYKALRPRITEDELASVSGVLSDSLAGLFFAMEERDQRHGLEVASRLREQGVTDRDLLAAALLHDCGKGAVPVWLRVLKVVSPRSVSRLADERAGGWRGSAYRLMAHGEIGSRLAESAGASARTARLIADRVEESEEPARALLHAADDAS
jgi:hypothetical protein